VPERRALLIGVSGFEAPLPDLTFAADAVTGLANVLRDDFGYTVTTLITPRMSGAELGAAVQAELAAAGPDTALIVHILTHGEAPDPWTLYALGADAAPDPKADIGHWLKSVQHTDGRPLTLFLLDLCQSGTVARLPWQGDYDSVRLRGWVLASSEHDQRAYNGAFTHALTTVLHDLANGNTVVDPALSFIPLHTVARAVRAEVNRLDKARRGYGQQVTASRVDLSDTPPELALFPNRTPADQGRPRPRAGIDAGLLPFLSELDEDLDVRHFLDRATGSAAITDQAGELVGCFSGRKRQLEELSPWLGGKGAEALAVVSGSPGVGKSALLGVLICAAHDRLREPTRPVWQQIAIAPPTVPVLAAVHAHGLGLAAITASLGRQLALQPDLLLGLDPLSPDGLQQIVRLMDGACPVVVLDALDEAEEVRKVARWLTEFAALTRPDGSPAVRLLVGTRPYEETEELRKLAGQAGKYVDLDAVPRYVLEDDLHRYVIELVRAVPAYREDGAVAGAFAAKVARTLAEDTGELWGEFLVAGIYTRHFLATFDPAAGSEEAAAKGSAVPRTLPLVFEMDLPSRADQPWLRPVLTAIAHTRGTGMPATVIARLAAAFQPGEAAPTAEQVRAALDAGTFYLRQSADDDHVTVYRLFHEGLAEHLRRSELQGRVLGALLSDLGPPDARVWGAAEPYVLQHALDHVAGSGRRDELLGDPGFLLFADSRSYVPALRSSARHRRLLSLLPEGPTLEARRAAFALAAVREGPELGALARRIANLPGEAALTWQPAWSAGPVWTPGSTLRATAVPTPWVMAALSERGVLRVLDGAESPGVPEVSSFTLAWHRGMLLEVVGFRTGEVRVGSGRLPLGPGHTGPVTGLTVVSDGERLLVVSGGEDGVVQTTDLDAGPIARITFANRPMLRLDAGGSAALRVAAGVTSGGKVQIWQAGGPPDEILTWDSRSLARCVAVGSLNGRTIVAAGCADGVTQTFDVAARTQGRRLGSREVGAIVSLGLGNLGGRTVAVIGAADGRVHVQDLQGGSRPTCVGQLHSGAVRSLSICGRGDRLFCLSGGADGVRFWELGVDGLSGKVDLVDAAAAAVVALAPSGPATPGAPAASGSAAPAAALVPATSRPSDVRAPIVAMTVIRDRHGRELAVLGDGQGMVQAIDPGSGETVHRPLPGDGEPVDSLRPSTAAGRPVVITTASAQRLWEPAGGAITDPLPRNSSGQDLSQPSDQAIVGSALVTVRGAQLTVCIEAGVIGTHDATVTALTTGYLADRPVAISGSDDGLVRLWDLTERRPVGEMNVDGPVLALAMTSQGQLLVDAGGEVIAFDLVPATGPHR
jgi:WD40 repeat protein